MEKNKLQIRVATKEDAEALLAIYAPYVEETAITFEYEFPLLEEFRCRIQETLKKYPYLVAEKNGKIVGYAYAGAFMPVRPMTGRWRPPSTSQSFRKEKESGKLCIKRWKDSFPGSIS